MTKHNCDGTQTLNLCERNDAKYLFCNLRVDVDTNNFQLTTMDLWLLGQSLQADESSYCCYVVCYCIQFRLHKKR